MEKNQGSPYLIKEKQEYMKIIIPIIENYIAPRFDLAAEVIIAECSEGKVDGKPRTILLSRSSADELCGLIIKEAASLVICGGIEEGHYKYLTWKKVSVLDSVVGTFSEALTLACRNKLVSGQILSTTK